MDPRTVFHKLNQHLEIVQKHYPIENIFGIFVIEITDDDIKSEAVIVPTFEHICTTICPIDETIEEGIRILDARKIYKATECGHPEVIQALYTEYKIVNPRYQHMFQKIYVNNRDTIKAGIASGIPADELKVALVKLCRYCWNEGSNVVRFIKQLTDAEKLALDGIIKAVGDEGVFSQAKVASAVGISRVTMSNLVMKMKFHDIAKVEYIGNKGTYIKFIDDCVLNINGEVIDYEGISN